MNKSEMIHIIKSLAKSLPEEPARYLFDKYIKKFDFNSTTRRTISDLFFESIRYYGILTKYEDFDIDEIKRSVLNKNLNIDDLVEIFGISKDIAVIISESLDDLNLYKFFLNRAPLTIRINPMKTTRDMLIYQLSQYDPLKTRLSPFGLIFNNHINVRQLSQFKQGLFEIQDEASQLIYNIVAPKPNEKILDLCAGTGGKSILLQSCSFNSLDLHAHDISQPRLEILQKRANILGIKITTPKKINTNFYDKVLIDAPCSGSGVIRRDVDNMIRLTPKKLYDLIQTQRNLIEQAISLVKSGGLIIYVTCSFLNIENEDNINYALNRFPFLELIDIKTILDPHIASNINLQTFYKTSPNNFNMDAFFAAVLKVKK